MRSIIHAAFSTALVHYAMPHELPHPGFVVLDSPVLTYREPDEVDIELTHNVVEHFYPGLLDEDAAQVVVVENGDPPENLGNGVTTYAFGTAGSQPPRVSHRDTPAFLAGVGTCSRVTPAGPRAIREPIMIHSGAGPEAPGRETKDRSKFNARKVPTPSPDLRSCRSKATLWDLRPTRRHGLAVSLSPISGLIAADQGTGKWQSTAKQPGHRSLTNLTTVHGLDELTGHRPAEITSIPPPARCRCGHIRGTGHPHAACVAA